MRETWIAAIALAAMLMLAGTAGAADPSLEWDDRYDGGGLYTDDGTVALADPAGNLIVGGESHDGVGGSDMLIRKLNRASHVAEWTTRFVAFDGNDMALTGMVWDGYGDILVGGYIRGCVG